jgi:hypothetical protein
MNFGKWALQQNVLLYQGIHEGLPFTIAAIDLIQIWQPLSSPPLKRAPLKIAWYRAQAASMPALPRRTREAPCRSPRRAQCGVGSGVGTVRQLRACCARSSTHVPGPGKFTDVGFSGARGVAIAYCRNGRMLHTPYSPNQYRLILPVFSKGTVFESRWFNLIIGREPRLLQGRSSSGSGRFRLLSVFSEASHSTGSQRWA